MFNSCLKTALAQKLHSYRIFKNGIHINLRIIFPLAINFSHKKKIKKRLFEYIEVFSYLQKTPGP